MLSEPHFDSKWGSLSPHPDHHLEQSNRPIEISRTAGAKSADLPPPQLALRGIQSLMNVDMTGRTADYTSTRMVNIYPRAIIKLMQILPNHHSAHQGDYLGQHLTSSIS